MYGVFLRKIRRASLGKENGRRLDGNLGITVFRSDGRMNSSFPLKSGSRVRLETSKGFPQTSELTIPADLTILRAIRQNISNCLSIWCFQYLVYQILVWYKYNVFIAYPLFLHLALKSILFLCWWAHIVLCL